ncbi:MAG: peptidoglycan domain protein [Bacteroidetes bacterium]|nr:peptidoglycan domain protein [Bacteroidota bacterium]
MADVNLLAPKILQHEGGFVDDHADHGGATNMGVTLGMWKQVGYDKDGDGDIDVDDLRMLTRTDATIVLKQFYWDRWQGDQILSQSVADILVDWLWCSGKWGIVIPQRILGVPPDGIVGPNTMSVVNSQDPRQFHQKVMGERVKFILDIVRRDPSQGRFQKGWLNRLNDFNFSI